MNIFGRNIEFRDILGRNRLLPGGGVDQSPAADAAAGAGAVPNIGLYDDTAVLNAFVNLMKRMPDPDEVLKQAGISRKQLRVLLTDDEIYQAFDTRRDAVLGTPLRLEKRVTTSGGPKPKDDKGIEGDDFAQFLVDQLNLIKTIGLPGIWNAVPQGYSVVEAVYTNPDDPLQVREDGRIGIRTFLEKPFEWFTPQPNGELRYFPDDGSAGEEGILCDQQFKFFLTRRRPTYMNPYGESLLSRLYWPWFFRHNGWKFWSKFVERFGSPLLVGKTMSPDLMTQALLMAHSNAVISIGRDDDVTAVGGANTAGGGDAFDKFETASIRRIQKLILGQTLTSGTDGGSGNRALGDVHDTVRRDKLDSDLELITPTVQRFIDALCVLNGKKAGDYTCFFADDTGLESDRATRDCAMVTAGQVKFTKSYYVNNYDFREDDIIVNEDPPGAVPPALDPNNSPDPNAPPKPGTKAPPLNKVKTPASRVMQVLEAFSHDTRTTRFTAQQNVIEDLADEALAAAGRPLATELIRSAVFAASDPADLEQRLFALVGETTLDAEQFRSVLEQALFTADVVGYVHAEGKV